MTHTTIPMPAPKTKGSGMMSNREFLTDLLQLHHGQASLLTLVTAWETAGRSKGALMVCLSDLVKRKVIVRVSKGLYALPKADGRSREAKALAVVHAAPTAPPSPVDVMSPLMALVQSAMETGVCLHNVQNLMSRCQEK